MAPASDAGQGSLLSRSPRSRKSLAVGSLASTAPAKRKRAHSIAPGENLKMDESRRRSLMRPTKGILKPFFNQPEDATQDLSRAYQTMPQAGSSPDDTLAGASLGEFRTSIRDADTRKSFGGRRVSFAAHAHVRVFNSAEQNANGPPSPAPSPAGSSSSASAPSDPASPPPPTPPPPYVSGDSPQVDIAPPDTRPPSRRVSMAHRRRSSIRGQGDEEGEGEESMDVSEDQIPPPTFPSSVPKTTLPPPQPHINTQPTTQDPNASEDDSDYEDDDGDMSMTGEFGPGIVARRRTMSMAGRERRKSRMRSSITVPPPPTGSEEEPMEFTVALDRPPPPESDALKALRAIANGNRPDDSAVDDDDEGEVDMDVTTAMSRLMAVRNSMGGSADRKDDSFSSTEDSFDGVDAGDRTVNVTNLMGSFRASDYGMDDDGDVTMSATSVVAAPITTRRESTIAPPAFNPARSTAAPSPPLPVPSQPSAPTTSNSRGPSSPTKSAGPRTASPTKQPAKNFTAAFAPSHQPPKRPLPGSQGASTTSSPNKKRAVALNESSTQRVPVPVLIPSAPTEVSSPKKGLPNKARRPSGYYRKSLGGTGTGTSTENAAKQFSSSTAGPQRRQSVAPAAHPVSPKKQVANSAWKPPPFAPNFSTNTVKPSGDVQREREERRQLVALPGQMHASPASASPRSGTNSRDSGEKQALAAGEDGGIDDSPAVHDPTPSQGMDLGEWASTVRTEDVPPDEDFRPISVDEFFQMTGIRFMDDLTCPRRSTVHPSQLQRRISNEGEDESCPLSEYAVAMAVDVPQLETMSWIANDIRSAIEKYKEQYRQTEKDAAVDVPLLFREFASASEDEREPFLYALKLIKANTIGTAKASWYEWKRGWVQGLQTNAQQTLDNLDADEHQLEDIATRAGQTLPNLRTEYEEIMREIEEEQAAVAEIENCDQQFLSELKATIAEQRQELDVYRNDIADCKSKATRLDETLEDLEDQAREAKTAISTAQRQMDMQKSSTRAEVFRLRDELSNLQDLHLWRATELSADRVEFVYDSKHKIVIPCRRFIPIPEALDVQPLDEKPHPDDDFPLVTEVMYRMARRRAVQDHDNKLTLRMIIQRLTDFWASYTQLRWQLSFIVIKYPLSFQLMPARSSPDNARGFTATATLLLFKKTSKAFIRFYFDNEMTGGWPMTIDSLKYEVSVAYGKADSGAVELALKRRLSEANTVENHACLVDACMEVVSAYS